MYIRTYYTQYTQNNNDIIKDIDDIKQYINIINKDIKDINGSIDSAFRYIDYLKEKRYRINILLCQFNNTYLMLNNDYRVV